MQSQFSTSYSPLSRPARATTPNRLKTVLGEWMTKLAGSDQPHVRCEIDRKGNAKWHVWDPVNGDRQTFSDEVDVRQWLEGRYYR
ncbi:MAG: hypothetical protein ACFB0C_15820 [Leptolyngbyaceae cyanobacterium]